MNYPGRFDAKASDVSTVSLDSDHFSFLPNVSSATTTDAGTGFIVVPDSHLLFSGDYKRSGNDLVLSSAEQKYVVHDYFKTDKRPTLVSTDGATLSGHIVSSLTGHVQYAQASAPAAGQVIGQVMKLTGSATAIRNGVAVELNIGDGVQKGDVIQTGSDSSIGLTLTDGTVFGMTSNARMVLNEMIYDPNGSSNSSLISLVQGTITFVAGQTAKNGNMRVDTPVATMGIRGTAVLVEISANDGPTKFSVLLEPDGKTGSFNLYDKATGKLLGTVSQAGQVTFVSPTGIGQQATATEQPKTLADLQAEKQLIQQVFQLYFPNYTPDDSKPNSTKTGPRTDIGVPENVIGKYALNPDTGRATITYTVPVTNPDTHQTTTVNIVYTNTPPIFSTTNAEASQSSVLGPNSFRLGDHVTITDPDIGVAPFFDVAFKYVANTGQLAQVTGPSSVPGTYLLSSNLLTLNVATGVVTFNPSAFQFLGEGETAVYRFTFLAASGVGGSGSDAATQTVTLTVTGQNDAPLFAVNDTPLAFDETAHQTRQSTPHLLFPIALNFTDEDFSDVASSFSVSKTVATNITGSSATTPDLMKLPDSVTLASYLTIDSTIDAATGVTRTALSNAGVVTGKFSAPDNAFDFLAEGEQVQIVYTITISDGHVDSIADTQTLTITITGTNDTPELGVSNDTFGLNETADATLVSSVSTLTSSGIIEFGDADLTDTHSTAKPVLATAVWLKPDGQGGYVSAGTVPPLTAGALADAAAATFISDSTGGVTGQVGWNFALADNLVDFLAENETLTLIYNIDVSDGHTDVGTATQTITIVITGTNDAPIVAAPLTLATNEHDAPVVRDLLAGASDLDNGETATLTVANIRFSVDGGATTTVAPDGVTFPDAHTINVDAAGIHHLAAGVTQTIVVSYEIVDIHGASVTQTETITITGVNDRPTLAAGTNLTTITEDETTNNGQTVASFATGISDLDDGALQGIAITGFTNSHGQWQYSIDGGSSWTNFGAYTASNGLLLGSDDRVRFVPDGNNGSFDTLTYVAWDQTSGTRGSTADTMSGSGPADTVAFSQASQIATLTVTDVNDAPVITSNGGGATASVSVAENTTAVTTVQSTDVDGPNVTYQIVTGAGSPDAAKFTINATTGELSFINAPDFEIVGNVNEDNAYIVQVRASDGSLSDIQTLTVNVTDVHEGPTYIVSSTADDTSPNTLRSAILFANANPGTMIVFAAGNSWNGAWVNTFSNLPAITGAGTIIDGTAGSAQVLLQASGGRIFTIGNGVDPIDVTIRNIGMRFGRAETQDGSDAMGGGIFVADNVHLRVENNVFIEQNHAASWNGGSAFGGAIYLGNDSILELVGRVQITQNDAYVSGTDINGISGIALGEGIYVAGPNGTIKLMPNQGDTILFGDGIANGSTIGGAQMLIIDGAGMVDVNAVSSFSGETTVSSGTLLVNYQGSLLNSNVTVESQGILIGGGSQPLYATGVGDLTVLSGGFFAPGSTSQYGYAVSTAVFRTGSLTLNFGATLAMDANGGSPGAYAIPGNIVGHDQVMVYGSVTINGATLQLGGPNGYYFSGNVGNSFVIIDNDGTDAVTGTFAGLNQGSIFFSGGQAYSISYQGGDGNDVVVTRYNDAPVVQTAQLTVSEGETVVLSQYDINASDSDGTTGFTFIVSNVQGGKFQYTSSGAPWVDTTSFTTSQLAAGYVRFVHDGSETPAAFDVQANDGGATNNLSNVVSATVDYNPVNDAPILDLNGPLSGTATTIDYTEYTVMRIAPTGVFDDVDNALLPGGSLTVEVTHYGSGTEVLGIDVNGPNNPLSINGVWIAYNGTNIASFSGGTNGNPLVISFRNVGTTPTYNGPLVSEIEALLQHITFSMPADNDPQSLPREITITAFDSPLGTGQTGQTPAIATINIHDNGNAPVAGDDFIAVRNDYGALKSTLTGNDSDADGANTFAISGAQFIVPDFSPIAATPITGGFKVEGRFGTLFLYSVATFDPIFQAQANAGDYVFNVGHDIDGNLISANDMAEFYDLAPGQTLTDEFTYTLTDNTNLSSTPATITVTYEGGPVQQYVLTSEGFDTGTLWDGLHFGTVSSNSATQVTYEYQGKTIVVGGKDLVLTYGGNGPFISAGLVKQFQVSDGNGNLFNATGYNIDGYDFGQAISAPNPTDLNQILTAYAYDIHGGAGDDVLFGGDINPNNSPRADRIDTGGGADTVIAYSGDDLIIVYDNAAWQIHGGAGIDTIKLEGQFDLLNGPAGQFVTGVEIFDLNKTYVNSVLLEAGDVPLMNIDATIRVLGGQEDQVALLNTFNGHPNGHWTLTGTGVAYTGDYNTTGVQFDRYEFQDGGTYATAYVEQGVNVTVDVLRTNAISVVDGMNGIKNVVSIVLQDSDQNAYYDVIAYAQHGSVTLNSNGMALDQVPVNATVSAINGEFGTGIVYTPDTPANPNDTIYDTVTVDVFNSITGLGDSLNFVFRQQGSGPATLTGTNGKDIIFSTDGQDVLTGLSGSDNFVFTNASANDTVTDFQVGIDHLVIDGYAAPFMPNDAFSFQVWRDNSGLVVQSGNDTVIALDPYNQGQNTIVLQNVQKAALSMNDFILHPSGGGGM